MQKRIRGATAALGVLAAIAMTIACGDEVTTCESAEDCDGASTGTGSEEACPPEEPLAVPCTSEGKGCFYSHYDPCGREVRTEATCKGGTWYVWSENGGPCTCGEHATESECIGHTGCVWNRTECNDK